MNSSWNYVYKYILYTYTYRYTYSSLWKAGMFAKYPNILHSEKWLGTWSPWFLAVLLHPSSITQKKTHPYLFPHDSLVYFAPYFAPQAPFSFFEMVLSTGHCPNCSSLSQVISFITRFITFHNCILFTCNPVFMSYHLFCARWKKKAQ